MFARVITGQTTPDGFDGLIRFTQERLPGTQAQPGFKGFYLLADRDTGELVNALEIDERSRRRQSLLHGWQQSHAAGERFGVGLGEIGDCAG